MKPRLADLDILIDAEAFAQAAAQWLVEVARSKDGPVALALAGGGAFAARAGGLRKGRAAPRSARPAPPGALHGGGFGGC